MASGPIPPPSQMSACFPPGYVSITQDICESQGCCWEPAEFHGGPHVDLPWCFRPNQGASEYVVTESTKQGKVYTLHALQHGLRVVARLHVHRQVGGAVCSSTNWCCGSNTPHACSPSTMPSAGDGLQAMLQLTKRTQKELGPDIETLQLDVEEVTGSILRIKLTDPHKARWEVPGWLLQSDLEPGRRAGGTAGSKGKQYSFDYSEGPFSFHVTRAGGSSDATAGATVFNTTGTRLVYKVRMAEGLRLR